MRFISLILIFCLSGCLPFGAHDVKGPDKQGLGTLSGAALGATSGAVTGAQLSAGAGPGAVVGMGFGAVAGAINGMTADAVEEDAILRDKSLQCYRERAWAQEILAEHYQRRLALHPGRDIFPADLFFDSDGVRLRPHAEALIKEIAMLSTRRMPWSRLVIASYAMSDDRNSAFAEHLSERRSQAIALEFVKQGIEPRRLQAQGVTVSEPVLIDPQDSPGRYRQAVEFIPLDY